MTWFQITLGLEEVANQVDFELRNQFDDLFIAANSPDDMALFMELMPGNEELKLYFTPGSVKYTEEIIKNYAGFACEKPMNKATLLAGNTGCSTNDLTLSS